MDWQVWIDTAGKLAPASVAFVVYLANRRQNAWNVAVAQRSSAMEDQKLRLSLLEKRASVISEIGDAPWKFVTDGADDVIRSLTGALTIAELVFSFREVSAIRGSLQNLQAWRSHMRAEETWRDRDVVRYQKAVDARSDAEALVFDGLSQLHRDLIAVARVDPLAPLMPSKSALSRIWIRAQARIKRR